MAKQKTYQDLQAELGAILQSLQSGELDIDDAIKQYERGAELIEQLEKYLKSAENKIKKIKLPNKEQS